MHELEAIVGLLLSIPDANLQDIINTLSRSDEFAHNILSKVSSSPFGPIAIQDYIESFPSNSKFEL
jgi:hypothetical protein